VLRRFMRRSGVFGGTSFGGAYLGAKWMRLQNGSTWSNPAREHVRWIGLAAGRPIGGDTGPCGALWTQQGPEDRVWFHVKQHPHRLVRVGESTRNVKLSDVSRETPKPPSESEAEGVDGGTRVESRPSSRLFPSITNRQGRRCAALRPALVFNRRVEVTWSSRVLFHVEQSNKAMVRRLPVPAR
jgi:hypothetical protein